MKKLLIILIVVALFLGLWSCGFQDKSQYDEDTNQHVSFHGINLQVPKAWKEDVKDEEYLEYAELEADGNYRNCLAVTFNQETKVTERIAEAKDGLEFAKKQYGDIDNIEQSSITIANMSAEKIEYEQKLGSEEGRGEIILIQTIKGMIEIMFYSPNKAGHDDFGKVLDSVTII